MKVPVSDEDAIRQVLRDGATGDFCDVAEAVKKKFGFTVGSGLVEKVYQDCRQDDVAPSDGTELDNSAVKIGHVDLSLLSHTARPSSSTTRKKVSGPATAVSDREHILEFVQQMGGFAAAREAITQLEQSLQGLLKT